jgi:hypothetical protein
VRAQDDEDDGVEQASGGVAKKFKKSSSSLARIAAEQEKARSFKGPRVMESTPPAGP